MPRPSIQQTFMEIAQTLAHRTTCSRRAVGCVLLDRRNCIVASGYNGVGRGLTHCTDSPCGGNDYKSGQGLEVCQAVHAEQNALMQCSNVWEIETAYVTASPCMHCAKLFLNTSVQVIYFLVRYDNAALRLLTNSGIKCVQLGQAGKCISIMERPEDCGS